jgi:hypothetical protein
MNEKINGLWDQAVTLVEQEPDGDWSLDTIKEKFAELIVRECLNQCYNRGMNDELYAGQLKAATYIEEHFGVEEK